MVPTLPGGLSRTASARNIGPWFQVVKEPPWRLNTIVTGDWYFDARYEIVMREEPLSMEEMRKLDLDLVAKIVKVPERKLSARSDSYAVSSQVTIEGRSSINTFYDSVYHTGGWRRGKLEELKGKVQAWGTCLTKVIFSSLLNLLFLHSLDCSCCVWYTCGYMRGPVSIIFTHSPGCFYHLEFTRVKVSSQSLPRVIEPPCF